MKNCVYRFLNKDNEIIYIGKATDLKQRISGHAHLPKECYEERFKIEYATFSTMDEVDLAERYLISKVKPKYNTEFKSKEMIITIDNFEGLQWLDYNSKNDTIIDFETRKEIVKIDLEIEKINVKIETVKNKKQIISDMKDEILEVNGKGRPCLVHIDENTRYHIYHDDELYNSTLKVNRNSTGLDEYANLYEKWWDEQDKEDEMLGRIDFLKNKKIDLLLKANNKTCDVDMKKLYKEYDSIDDEYILNKIINGIENQYKRSLSESIINDGYYDYNTFVQNIDHEFIYNKYSDRSRWLRLIENIEFSETRIKCANYIINNVESHLEYLFGKFKVDTIIKEGNSMFNHTRVLSTPYLVKKPINI